MLQDLRFGLRMLVKKPGFTLVAICSLALGISANTAIFSVVNAALLRPLAASEPEQLVGLYRKIAQDPNYNRFSYPHYIDVRDRNKSFSGLAAYYFTPFNLSGGGATERVYGKVVTGNYFEVLGVAPALGRAFAPEEDRTPGSHAVAVISHGLFERRFGADRQIIGQQLTLNGHAFTVIGVAPPEFKGAEIGMSPDVYVPMMMQPHAMPGRNWLANRGIGWLRVVGRLKPGVSATEAQAEMSVLGEQMRREDPRANEAFGIAIIEDFGIHPQFRGTLRLFLLVLMGVVGLVLAIACANVGSLLLARASERQREIGVRLALGASRWRLTRQLLTESLLLAALGGLLGLLLTPWLMQGLGFVIEQANPLPTPIDIRLDARVLVFTLALSALAGIIFGLAPALGAARTDLVMVIKGQETGRTPSRSRLRSIFVATQAALSVVLLLAAGLFIRSLVQAQRIDVGFDTSRQLLLEFDLGLQGYTRERGRAFLDELERRVTSLPGVETAAYAGNVPLGPGSDQDRGIAIDGYQPPSGLETVTINFNVVGANYFQTMSIPLVAGRSFGAQDHADSPPVAIVNEAAARRFWPGRSAVGERLRYGAGGPEVEVIGIARDSKYITLGESDLPYLYTPMSQSYSSAVVLQVRAAGDPLGLAGAIEREIAALDADLPVYRVRTMSEHLRGALLAPRLAALLLGIFGAAALLLSAIGIYGVVAYAVSQRTQEIGIRLALGAGPGEVMRLVLRRGLLPVWMGMAAGAVAAMGVSRLLAGFLYGISANDPLTFAAVMVVLGAAAIAAAYFPARRAMRIDPLVALRYE